MEINRIFQFRAVFETENIREAASLLRMTPGALSKAIKVLENEVGVSLFVQKGRNIVPTEEARSFYHNSRDLLDSYNNLMSSVKGLDVECCSKIKIATWEVFSSYFIGILAEKYFKNESFKVLERTPHLLEQSILKGEADIGLSYAPVPHKELTIFKVVSFSYGVFAKKGVFEDTELEKLPFAVPITIFPSSPTGVKTLDNWPEDIERTIQYEFELLETALETTRKGLSVLYCPKFVANIHNKSGKNKLIELSALSRSKSVKRDVYLIIRKSMDENQVVKKIAKALRVELSVF